MRFFFGNNAALFLLAAPVVTLCASPVLAAPPEFTGKVSARQSAFNDFINRNANKDVVLSLTFDPGSDDHVPGRVEEPTLVDAHDPPVYAVFMVADHYYLLDANGTQWEKTTRYDKAARKLEGTFRVSFVRTTRERDGSKTQVYRLRYLSSRSRANATNNASGRVADDFAVVPGERIGRVFLGDSPETVHRRLGVPTGPATSLGSGLTAETWPANTAGSKSHGLVVVYQNKRAVQIEATAPSFRTSGNVNFASPPDAWTQAYGRRESVVMYKFPASAKRPIGYEDWMKKGIAYKYEFLPYTDGAGESEDEPIRAISLIVHRRGARVIPDKNAQWSGGDLSARQ